MQNTPVNKCLINSFAILAVVLSLLACTEQAPTVQLTVEDYPEYDSDAARLYLTKCGDCHAAPLPSIHPASQWPGVVQRMQFRMTSKAMRELNDYERETIVGYLQKHAGKE